jgi:uncharacterized protein
MHLRRKNPLHLPQISQSNNMKAVLIGESSGASMETIMAVYPRHEAVAKKFIESGDVIGIGPFTDRGNMAIFKSREAAEQFAKEDPFILEGLVKSFVIRDWNDTLLPG